MAERILATGAIRGRILTELQAYRDGHVDYVKEVHPQEFLLSLSELTTKSCYSSLIRQPLFLRATHLLAQRLKHYGPYELLDPARVWIGVTMPDNEKYFGGFYHHDQGYRYLQQIAIMSLSGVFSSHRVDYTLATLELIRAYAHDTLHYNSYRLFCPLPQTEAGSFYRLQYGINFRKWNGVTYSARDSVRSTTTRNLGNIMEAATDRFAHELVVSLAQETTNSRAPHHWQDMYCDPVSYYVYRDCTGQLTKADICRLRDIETGRIDIKTSTNFKIYLKSMRIFVQFVNLRYNQFLTDLDPKQSHQIHHLIIQSMLSGKMKELCKYLDTLLSEKRSFASLFKTSYF